MNFAERFERAFRSLLPAPFTIAVLLTLLTMVLALIFGDFKEGSPRAVQVLDFWQKGLWNAPLLVFAVQMMLILVLGHTLALAPVVSRFIERIADLGRSPATATFLVAFFTIAVALFNWGLGLIFGAILARKTGERFAQRQQAVNYPLLGAAGYAGLMVWHGGLSGSAPLKVKDAGHLQSLMAGVSPESSADLPSFISLGETIFSPMNLVACLALLVLLPSLMAWLAAKTKAQPIPHLSRAIKMEVEKTPANGAERLDHSRGFALLFSLLIIGYAAYLALRSANGLDFISLNYINFLLLGLCLLFHGNFARFLKAVDQAILGASGILIQFPLYFGIMGIMASSGLISQISSFFISISNETTFPIFTFFSAGLVNVFVPSGGGQWAVQGPIIIEAATRLGTSLPKSVMALAYGDQLTNMLQPFWALPLLGITGLKAREILPYTLYLLLAGMLIFIPLLLIF